MLAPLRHLTGPRYGWLAGLPLLGLVWAGATVLYGARIERALEASGAVVGAAATEGSPEPWLRVSALGRDLVARGEAPGPAQRDAALGRLAALSGSRLVRSEVSLIEEASPFVWTAVRGDGEAIALSGSRPAEIGRAALAALLTAGLPAATALSDEARAARGAPPGFPAAAAFAVSRLRDLARGSAVTVTGTVLDIRGEAVSVRAYDALRAALAEPPRGYSIGRLDILPPTVADIRFGVERRRDGGLVLTGHVPSEAARTVLRAQAAEVAEGALVDDRTQTARGLPASIDGDGLTRFAFRLAGLLRQGDVRFETARLSVTGDALDAQARDEIAVLMREARPAGVGAGTLGVGVLPLSPYTLAIRREAESVILSGHLPDAAARERLLAAVRPRFFRERIVDRTRLADGAPAGLLDALEAAVPRLATLASGEVAVADTTVTLSGESLYRQSAERLGASLPRALPAAWTARVSVQARDPAERRDPETCRRRFAAETAAKPLAFEPGSALLKTDFYPLLDAVASLAKACPDLRITVGGYRDPPGTRLPKPAPDAGVPATASIAETPGAKKPGAKASGAETPGTKASGAQATSAKTTNAKTTNAKTTNAKTTNAKTTSTESADGKGPAAKGPAAKAPVAKARGEAAPAQAATVKTPPAPAPSTAGKAAAAGPKAARTMTAGAPAATAVEAVNAPPDAAAAPPDKVVATATEKVASAEGVAAEPDLARQRALAVLEYLLTAGVPLDRIVAGDAGRPDRLAVSFALRP